MSFKRVSFVTGFNTTAILCFKKPSCLSSLKREVRKRKISSPLRMLFSHFSSFFFRRASDQYRLAEEKSFSFRIQNIKKKNAIKTLSSKDFVGRKRGNKKKKNLPTFDKAHCSFNPRRTPWYLVNIHEPNNARSCINKEHEEWKKKN